jgi:predicted DCC family thiol-disulfide oxidoreductase YuxK
VERVYYDGECGFCHGWVRGVLRREPPGGLFRFAPLQGPTFASRVPPERRAGMASTFVVETGDGRLLVRTDAVIHVLRRLGRRRSAALLAILPRPVRDLGYRAVARVRRALAPRPRGSCPVADPETRARFDP